MIVTAPAGAPERAPCIRCGDCADACPARLQPQLMLLGLRAGRDDVAGLDACESCGRCDRACPTRIPLHSLFARALAERGARQQARAVADAARERFHARDRRLQREAVERERGQASREAAGSSADAVAAALARARARRGQSGPGP